MIDIPQPRILDGDAVQQMAQMKSYLFQLSQTLNWAFGTIETGGAGSAAGQPVVQVAGEKESPKATFNSIKDLIIKSAEIVNAYYDKINERLEGIYVAESEFGTFKEQTSQEIEKNSMNITQLFSNYQIILDRQIETSAYIKTGLLGYKDNAEPIYGLEIGQQNNNEGQITFQKYARFTADKLSFYDSDNSEVAYISDYRLHITNVNVNSSLVLMDQFEVVQGNGTIDFRWMGG